MRDNLPRYLMMTEMRHTSPKSKGWVSEWSSRGKNMEYRWTWSRNIFMACNALSCTIKAHRKIFPEIQVAASFFPPSFLSFLPFFSSFACIWLHYCMYICAPQVYLVPTESWRGTWIPWKWNYRLVISCRECSGTRICLLQEQSVLLTTESSPQHSQMDAFRSRSDW